MEQWVEEDFYISSIMTVVIEAIMAAV